MSPAEITFAETLVHNMCEWNLATDHVVGRMKQKGIKKDAIVNTLKYGDVIEVADNGRVTLRLMKGMANGTCVVVSLRDKVVVTCWYNNPKDRHATLDLSDYTMTADVVTFLRSIK